MWGQRLFFLRRCLLHTQSCGRSRIQGQGDCQGYCSAAFARVGQVRSAFGCGAVTGANRTSFP